jgi:hypothetical protein
MKVELGLGVVLVCVFVASSSQMREERQPPHGAQAIGDNALSKGRAATGARSAKPDNVKCALPTSEEAVRLQPHSAQAHYNLGVARVCARNSFQPELPNFVSRSNTNPV